MSLTSSLLHPLHSLKLSTTAAASATTFLHGTTPLSLLAKPTSVSPPASRSPVTSLPPIRAMRSLQGRVVCSTNDKTVAVEVTRLAPHPKYKRRVRKKKKYQAHDPDNRFKVGDFVQLEKSRPISKTKTFLAVPIAARNARASKSKSGGDGEGELGLPLESQGQQQA
ncbi:30S ribosomal protein S17, chloroplastic [Rhodamnia argentea]|uniref:Small ribosomal subunit protein uS17c n=1 Tax=Rhodamnia argentea TaxID=178133 RepID=A0A8B8NSR8_9MYRT|nr:30S ribosomal protein S17, chloroplastic [Rhodamnia argentea]